LNLAAEALETHATLVILAPAPVLQEAAWDTARKRRQGGVLFCLHPSRPVAPVGFRLLRHTGQLAEELPGVLRG
ncbi:MAG: hypothetical protein AB1758_34780, partial [Candidatus Eremiobacterota bacterium]